MASPTGPNISVTASAGNVKVVMSEVQKELERINATPLEQLRDKSEESLEAINQTVNKTVRRLVDLKTSFANTGTVDTRSLKAAQKQFEALGNLGIDRRMLQLIDNTLGELDGRGSREERAQSLREQRAETKRLAKEAIEAEKKSQAESVQARARQEREAEIDLQKELADVRAKARAKEAAALRAERKRAAEDAIEGVRREIEQRRRLLSPQDIRSGGPGPGGGGGNGGGGRGPGAGGPQDEPIGFRNVVGLLDSATGGRKFDLNKGLRFGLAGVVAGFVSDALAGATQGALDARNEGGSAIAGAAKSLPIVRGLAQTFTNIYELYTDIGRASEVQAVNWKREASAISANNALLNERLRIIAESERLVLNQREAFAAGQTGGRAGRIASLDAQYAADIRNLGAQQLDRRRQIGAETASLLEPLRAEEIALRGKLANTANETTRGLISSQVTSNLTAQAKILEVQRQRVEESNAAFKAQAELVGEIYAAQSNAASGRFENTKLIQDELESLQKTIDTMSGDPIEQMRREFEKATNASAYSLGLFEKTLSSYQKRLEQVRKERLTFNATEEAKSLLASPDFIPGSSIDQKLGALRAVGVDEQLVAQVKIRLETDEAKRQAQDLKRTLQDIGSNIRVTLARSTIERVREEIEAESQRRLRETGVGLSPQQRRELESGKLDEFYAGEAARTRESAKSPAMRLEESLRSLTEQFRRGFITDRELRFGVGQTIGERADAERASRPQLITGDQEAEAARLLATMSGQVADAENPQFVLQREANSYLKGIHEAVAKGRPASFGISGF